MFHTQNGLFYQRATSSGSVRIVKTNDGREPSAHNVVFDETLPGGVWGSVIASVSKLGEENGRWYQAMDWHNGPVEDEGI